MSPSSRAVVVRLARAVVLAVAAYDLAVGAWMIASPEPWLAHGPGTEWRHVADALPTQPPEVAHATLGLFRRIGAFSLFAGAVGVYVAATTRREPRALLRFMLLFAVAGLAFAVTDGAHFAGTAYHLVKQAIGTAWVVAAGALWWATRGEPAARAPDVAGGADRR